MKELDACEDGYKTFIEAHGGKTVTFSQALDSNGWSDIWWLISEIWQQLSDQQQKQIHLLGCDWAEQTLINFEKCFPNDNRPRLAIEAKRKWLNGDISDDELETARFAARSAARSAESARSAVRSTESAWSAARSAAWSAESARFAAKYAAESTHMKKCTCELKKLFLKWESNND